MRDAIEFSSPLGLLGWCVDKLFLADYLIRLIRQRNEVIKDEAERRSASPNQPLHNLTSDVG